MKQYKLVGFNCVLLFLAYLICFSHSQQCIDRNGNNVDWWVMLTIPGRYMNRNVDQSHPFSYLEQADEYSKGCSNPDKRWFKRYPGYAYYDSNNHYNDGQKFEVFTEKPDSYQSPLGRTFTQINNLDMETIAWNDEPLFRNCTNHPFPWDHVQTAHSKAVGAYDFTSKKGFFISHSIPKYPCIDQNNKIRIQINYGQQIFGQDLFCISGDLKLLKQMAGKVDPMNPIYYKRFNWNKVLEGKQSSQNQDNDDQINLQNQDINWSYLEQNGIRKPIYDQLFSYLSPKIGKSQFQMIFKTGNVLQKEEFNKSIIDQGVTQMLDSSIISQTWKGNEQYDEKKPNTNQSPFCSSRHHSARVMKIKLNSKFQWPVYYDRTVKGCQYRFMTGDHSKWIITTSRDKHYACLGDMNRHITQEERGGAFYCINSKGLHKAFSSIIDCEGCKDLCHRKTGEEEL